MRVTGRSELLSKCVIVVTILISCCIVRTKSDKELDEEAENYISTSYLADGEKEIRMRFGDIIVKETSITSQEISPVERTGLLLRQVSSGQILLQMIYKLNARHGRNNNRRKYKLVECEIINEWSAADQFRHNFKSELRNSGLSLQVQQNRNYSNFENSEDYDDDDSMDEESSSVGDSIDLNNQTFKLYQNVTARILQNDEIVGELQESFDIIMQQKLCKRLHRKLKHAILAQKLLKAHLKSDISSHGLSRKKREIGDAFRVPGTRWCGVGSSAKELKQMGAFAGADKCCRFHDLGCPHSIRAFEEMYGYYHWGLWTLNHCACDERFRSCLKTTNTGAANLVGKLFFNIVQNKCFVLKTEKVCTNRSWWGKCLHYELKKQAHVRDPVQY